MSRKDIVNGVTESSVMTDNSELFESRVKIPGYTEQPADVKATPELRARGLIRGLLLVLQHHEAPKGVIDSFQSQAMDYLRHDDETIFFNRAKYFTTRPMAQYLGCEQPKIPDLDFKPRGVWKNWAKTRLRVFCRKNTHLWYSFLQAKRSALPLSQDLVLATYEKHQKAMQIKDPIDDDTHDLVMKELEPILNRIRLGIRHQYDTDDREDLITSKETSHVASSRAAYESSRGDGGQLGYLVGLVPELQSCNPENPTTRRTLPDLVRMTFVPIAVVNGRVVRNSVFEEYRYTNGETLWQENVLQETVRYVRGRRLNATIQAVLEPLKVRVISKGEAIPYYISKPLQRAMHDVMRNMPCFRLIGRPLCPTDLIDCAENRCILGEGDYNWFSIDYSAATDNLSARLSRSIMLSLLEGQDEFLRAVWLSVLAPHTCHYPPVGEVKLDSVEQENGQLMGSILSFPILCLANLGLYLANTTGDSRPLWDRLNGVLVNGDDMLYVARKSLWNQHITLGERVGLVMSPGKAYCHPVYANANSACYHHDLRNRRSTPWAIAFLNSGLYFGQSKVLGGDDESGQTTISATINRLLEGALPGKAPSLLAQFLSRHGKQLQSEARGRNLFVSPSLGGMGVIPPVGWNPRFTLAQRVEARRRLDEEPCLYLGAGPSVGPTPPEMPQPLKAPWLVPPVRDSNFRLRGWKGKPRLLKKKFMSLATHLCVQPRSNSSGILLRQVPNRNYQRDFVTDSLRESAIAYDIYLNSVYEDFVSTSSWFDLIEG